MSVDTRKEREIALFQEEIAARVAQGRTVEQVAYEIDLSPTFVSKLVQDPAFVDILRSLDPEAARIWEETREEEFIQKRVRDAARDDGPSFYQEMKNIALNGNLRDDTRVATLEKLLKLGGYFKEREIQEVTQLSPSQLQTLVDATREMDAED